MLYNLQVSKSFASTLLLNTQFSSHLHSICLSAQAKLKNDMKNSPHFLHFTFKYSSSPTALSNVTYKKSSSTLSSTLCNSREYGEEKMNF